MCIYLKYAAVNCVAAFKAAERGRAAVASVAARSVFPITARQHADAPPAAATADQ